MFAAASNFFCPSNIQITGEQEVLTLDKKEGTINIHDNNKTLQLNATYTGTNAVQFVWSSSAESVATVDQNGLVTGVAVGETIITAKKSETLKVQAKITVVDKNVTTVTIKSTDFGLSGVQKSIVDKTIKGLNFKISGPNTSGICNFKPNYFGIYKGNKIEISCNLGLINKVIFTCNANGTAKGGPKNFTGTNYTAGEEETGIWELATGASSLSLTASEAQVQITQMEISYIPSAE